MAPKKDGDQVCVCALLFPSFAVHVHGIRVMADSCPESTAVSVKKKRAKYVERGIL